MNTRTTARMRIPLLIAVLVAVIAMLVVVPAASAYEVDCHRYDPSTGQYDYLGRRTVDEATWYRLHRAHYGHQPVVQPVTPDTGYDRPAAPDAGSTDALTAEEQAMVSMVNQARAEAGLSPLRVDLQLVMTARMKSQDMIDNAYFGHTSPTYGSPFDLMRSQGIVYRYAGENLAGAATVERAHSGLMNSDGHRANILSPNYTRIGVGVVNGGIYGKMFTQHFAG